MKNGLIEGWRGVNHSFALVNQCQILEFLREPGLRLFHRDLPFAMPHWNAATHGPGYAAADWARIAALQPPQGEVMDWIMRVCSPFRTGHDCAEALATPGREAPLTLSFMITEMGLSNRSFEPGAQNSEVFTRGANQIVTSTHWSRDRILEWGYAPEKVHVVSCGVNSQTFCPMADADRQRTRANLGFDSGHCVFLNLGAAMWNKGMDVLLLAFARLRQKHRHIRLVIKDQQSLYGIGMDKVLGPLRQSHPDLFTDETLASISAVTANLSQGQLRQLYAMADCYVSPYRAEGFNLPVLEAIACGTPVIVTDKGATDDFCSTAVALRIDSRAGVLDATADRCVARYQEPSPDATVSAMDRMASGSGIRRDAAFDDARKLLTQRLSWGNAVQQLLALTEARPQARPEHQPVGTGKALALCAD